MSAKIARLFPRGAQLLEDDGERESVLSRDDNSRRKMRNVRTDSWAEFYPGESCESEIAARNCETRTQTLRGFREAQAGPTTSLRSTGPRLPSTIDPVRPQAHHVPWTERASSFYGTRV